MKWYEVTSYQKRIFSRLERVKFGLFRVWRAKIKSPLRVQFELATGRALRVTDNRTTQLGRQSGQGFFIGCNECTSMGVCQAEVPGLIEWSQQSQTSEVVRQPETPAELNQMINAITVCAMDAVRYGGHDPEILSKLANLPTGDPRARFTWLGRIFRRLTA